MTNTKQYLEGSGKQKKETGRKAKGQEVNCTFLLVDKPSTSLDKKCEQGPNRYLEGQFILSQKQFLTRAEFTDVMGQWVQKLQGLKGIHVSFDY